MVKKHYKPVLPDMQRPVLEHVLFACCLEDAHYQAAEEAFAAVVHTFFDLNEIRVTSIAELCEVMSVLPAPKPAAHRLKRMLQAIFEATYAFDLEECRKKNLGPTIKWLQELDGATNFVVSYVVQSALGGHAIPIGVGEVEVLHIVDMVTEKDVKRRVVPGLERAVAKSKGIEFGSMLHQLGADFVANRFSPAVQKILLQIDPNCKDRFPKRRSGKKPSKKSAAAKSKTDPDGKKTTSSPETPAATSKKKSSASQKQADVKASSESGSMKDKKSASEGLSKRKPR
ncbi:MAG: hypothetical protein HQ567_28650 [Candidatus Nealsonbacteria bacterium]|nr:hypothetical protein [Candidatus Nealsonbacteria bacterium]